MPPIDPKTGANCPFKCASCDASCISFFGIPAFLKRYGLWPFGGDGLGRK